MPATSRTWLLNVFSVCTHFSGISSNTALNIMCKLMISNCVLSVQVPVPRLSSDSYNQQPNCILTFKCVISIPNLVYLKHGLDSVLNLQTETSTSPLPTFSFPNLFPLSYQNILRPNVFLASSCSFHTPFPMHDQIVKPLHAKLYSKSNQLSSVPALHLSPIHH